MADHRVAPEATTLRASATATSAVGRVTLTTSTNGIRCSVGRGVEAGDGLRGEVGDDGAVVEPEESGCGTFPPGAWQPASSTVTSAADAAGPLIRPA